MALGSGSPDVVTKLYIIVEYCVLHLKFVINQVEPHEIYQLNAENLLTVNCNNLHLKGRYIYSLLSSQNLCSKYKNNRELRASNTLLFCFAVDKAFLFS